MSILEETTLTNGIVSVGNLCEGDVLDTAELICMNCNEVQPLSTMHYDFEERHFICEDCAAELLEGETDDGVPDDTVVCIDELGEADFDPDQDF